MMKDEQKTNKSTAEDDLDDLFQTIFGSKLEKIQDEMLSKIQEIGEKSISLEKKLRSSTADLTEKIEDLEESFGRRQKRATDDLIGRLNSINGKLPEVKNEILDLVSTESNRLNDANLKSIEQAILLTTSLSELITRVDKLERGQEKLVELLSIIESKFDNIEQKIISLDMKLETSGEANYAKTQVLVTDVKDEVIKNFIQSEKDTKQLIDNGFNILQGKIKTGFEINKQLVEGNKKQTSTLIEDYYQSQLQQNHELVLQVDEQFQKSTIYSKVLLVVNIVSLIVICVLIYLFLTLN